MIKPGTALCALHDALVHLGESNHQAAEILRVWRAMAAHEWYQHAKTTDEEKARGLRELLNYERTFRR